MPKPNRLAAAGLAVLALGACTAEESDGAAPDETTSAAATTESAAPSESEPTDTGCDATFDPATDDSIMEPYVGEWISEERSPAGADWPETSTACIEADGTVTYEAPAGIWEGHLTVGDESVPMMDLDQVERLGRRAPAPRLQLRGRRGHDRPRRVRRRRPLVHGR